MTAPPPDWRARLVRAALDQLGTPYQWGGGHGSPDTSWGVDCSGLINRSAARAGITLPHGPTTAHGFWTTSTKVRAPLPGDLVLYGTPAKATHVVLVTGEWDGKTAPIVGANNGDSTTTSPERAAQQGAKVMEKPTHLFRKDVLGFVALFPGGAAAPIAAPPGTRTDDAVAGGLFAALLAWWLS